ncbi:hypothetical protein FBU59_001313, partial [Linderina macrospora]
MRAHMHVQSSQFLNKVPASSFAAHAFGLYKLMGATDHAAQLIGLALHARDSATFAAMRTGPYGLNSTNIITKLAEFDEIRAIAHQPNPLKLSGSDTEQITKDRNISYFTKVDHMKARNKHIDAVADPGSQVTLITVEAAKMLGLRIRTRSRPTLKALWPGADYVSLGRAHVELQVEAGPKVWDDVVVVDFPTRWQLLVGNKTLKRLGIEVVTPAMRKRITGFEKTADHPSK